MCLILWPDGVCRHHRYIFEEKKKGQEGTPQVAARLQELGPRFTLKLQSLQVVIKFATLSRVLEVGVMAM